ncbi:MAG: glycosyltransferase family 2 protein [Bacteroidota bacterium]
MSAYLWLTQDVGTMIVENFRVLGAKGLIFQIVEIILAAAVVLPCTILFVEVLIAFFNRNQISDAFSHSFDDGYTRTILVPAHNEAAGIKTTLLTITSQMREADQLLVVADNCTDTTADIAQEVGADVIFRDNQRQRGKGYALDFGLQHLSQSPPDVVVMVDADCRVLPGAIDAVSTLAMRTNRPVQATYLLEAGPQPSPKEMISTFAFKVKNLVRPFGISRLGYPCLLTGSGMAFPWSVISEVDLATGNLVEDMQLGLDLSVAGHLPLLCPSAVVLGAQPQQLSVARSQRTRWEHGHLRTLSTSAALLLWEGFKQRRLELIILALDVSVPPLALLVMLWSTTAIFITIFTVVFNGSWLALLMVFYAGVSLISAITLSWYGFAQADIPIDKLIYIPLYILWKVPVYFNFLIKPERDWIRTERK